MKKFLSAGAALLLTTTVASAGGLDRSGQSISPLFEDGTYAELSYGYVVPSVSGTAAAVFGGGASGSVAPEYSMTSLAFKTDVNDKISLAFIMDSPFGANIDYTTAGYPISGTSAHVNTSAITVLGQYHINENISVFAGPRLVTADGTYTQVNGGTTVYDASYESDSDTGYVVGAAYEIPDIALRAALTYSSETNFAMAGSGTSLGGSVGDLTATMPQSINLDFQTGVAANTLAFANIRWANWSAATIDDANTAFFNGDGNLSSYANDVMTYTVGIGRRFSDNFAGQIAVGYEAATGDPASDLSPTDGFTSVSIGGAYTLDSGLEISGGVKYVWLGDATTEIGSTFEGNTAIGYGLKVSYNF